MALGGYAYDRLRGNPRGKAIELLAGLGPKAKAAVPVLKKIAESEDDKDKKLRDAALKAVEAIMGK